MPEGRTAARSSRCRAILSRRRRVAAMRDGLRTLRAQLEDLLGLVGEAGELCARGQVTPAY